MKTLMQAYENKRKPPLKPQKTTSLQQAVLLLNSIFAMKDTLDFFQTRPSAEHPPLHITDEAEACAAVLMACLRANELDEDAENVAFYTTISSRNIFKGHDAQLLVASAGEYYEQAGSPAALIDAAIGAIREQTRLPLFYHCLDVILADGLVTPREHEVYRYLKGKFKVDAATAAEALEVLLVKNQL